MSASESIDPPASTRLSPWLALRVLIVRLRFFLVLLAVLLLVGTWPLLRRYGQRLTGAGSGVTRGMSSEWEFWCPMCPGVSSDWPGKCPVCNMALVRRKRSEAAPLPDGVLARMQFSPYRVQLAGIRTVAVEYRPLRRQVVLVGSAERSTAAVGVRADVFAADLPFLTAGQPVEARAAALPGHAPFRGKIAGEPSTRQRQLPVRPGSSEPAASAAGWTPAAGWAVQLEIDDPDRDLRSGMLVTACAEAPIARLPWWRRAVTEELCKNSAAEMALHMLLNPGVPVVSGRLSPLLRQAGAQVLLSEGYGLAVPCGAVVDHGSRKVVFIETGPGMFDAVEIAVGPRCGDYYPVLRGLDANQRVAAAGAFLLDAEMWLNHGLAAAYFGASRNAGTPPPPAPPGSLLEEDRLLAAKQKICPVTGKPLDSMGGPVRLVVQGRVVFVCCEGCEGPLREEPEKYLSKLPAK